MLGLVFLPTVGFATVDYLAVNHWTNEYFFWGDDDRRQGWIGWEVVSEAQTDTAPKSLAAQGYSETFFPWKIESGLLMCLMLSVLIWGLKGKKH